MRMMIAWIPMLKSRLPPLALTYAIRMPAEEPPVNRPRPAFPEMTEAQLRLCERLDCSRYHLDGTQATCHLDHLLGIEALDAIEWTPQAGIETGGSLRWYGLYKRIIEAGKSVQIMGVRHEEIIPLLDAIGGKGVYIVINFASEREAEELAVKVEAYR